MRRPGFWEQDGLPARSLLPLALAWTLAARCRQALRTPVRLGVPVVCCGNVTAGGTGKTPAAIALAGRLAAAGWRPHLLSRGYRGRLKGPLQVDAARHTARDVGDEPLLLARAAPTWIGADRAATARCAVAGGADILVMDDGLQNPSLARDLSILVVDGPRGLGNGRVMPAGPLREPLGDALARCRAVLIVGEDSHGLSDRLAGNGRTLLRAELQPAGPGALDLDGVPVHAFAGIGRPEKFFATLEAMGAVVLRTRGFPDHHVFDPLVVTGMLEGAHAANARLVTTEKDWIRLDADTRPLAEPVPVDLVFRDTGAVDRLLAFPDRGCGP